MARSPDYIGTKQIETKMKVFIGEGNFGISKVCTTIKNVKPFIVSTQKLSGSSDDKEVVKRAQDYFRVLMQKSKRQSYIRSAYFDKKKVFFTYFWKHLYQKPPKQRKIRVMFLPCAIELIQKCRNAPESMINTSKEVEIFHRFKGITKEKEIFYVQIKENIKTDRKEFMSVFPDKN